MYKKVLIILLITLFVSISFNLLNNPAPQKDFWGGVSIESKLSANEKKWIGEKRTLVAGVSDSLVPLVTFRNGEAEGLLVDFTRITFDEINLTVVFKPVLEKDMEEELAKGMIDFAFVIPFSSVNNEMNFTLPIIPVKGKLCVPSDSTIKSIDEVENKKIIVTENQDTGVGNYKIVQKNRITYVDSMEAGLALLKSGEYDGLLGNEMAIAYLLKSQNSEEPFKTIPSYVYEKNLSIATVEGSPIDNITKVCTYYASKSLLIPTLQEKWFGLSYNLKPVKAFGNIAILLFVVFSGVAFVFYLFYFSNKSLYEELATRMDLVRLSKNELQATFDGVNYYMAEIDRDCCVVNINKSFEEYLNIKRRNAVSQNIAHLLQLNDSLEKQLTEGIKSTFNLEKAKEMEIAIGRKILEIRMFPINDSSEKVFKVLLMAIDVTDDHSAKRQLIQDNKMIAVGQLAAGVAHEIRNPLGIIRSYCFLLKTQAKNNPEVIDKAVSVIEKSVERSGKIIDNLLNFSRSSNNKIEEINLKEEIYSIISLQKKALLEKKITIEIVCDPNIVVNLLVESLEMVLINLVSNAADAMPLGGMIKIICSEREDVIQLEVQDQGTGIPEDVKSEIFNPFFTTKERNEGNGLGLYLVYNEIQKMNGTIDLDSKMGVGTTFIINFPKNSEVKQGGE